jgi:hypothetical protein
MPGQFTLNFRHQITVTGLDLEHTIAQKLISYNPLVLQKLENSQVLMVVVETFLTGSDNI